MEENKKKKTQQVLMAILVTSMLFIFPAASWYYLQSGLNHRKKALAELTQFGKAGDFQLKNQNNLLISQQGIRGKVSIVSFFPAEKTTARELADRMAKVHQSFNEVDDVVFLSFIPADTSVQLLPLAQELSIKDNKQWYLLGTSQEEWKRLATESYHLPNLENSVVLVDTSLTIRKYYDIHNNEDMGRLVEQTVLILPQQKRR